MGWLWGIVKETWRSFGEDKAPRLGAALAYYTVFSIPPLLVLLIATAGMVFGREAVQDRVVRTVAELIGPQGANAVADMMGAATETRRGVIATVVGLLTLLLGASGVFAQLKDALNTLWEVEPRPGRGIRAWLGKYVFSVMVLLGTEFLLLVSLGISAALGAVGDYLAGALPGGEGLWHAVNLGGSLVVIAFLFALLFRYVPDARVAWRDALIGGAVTSVLFTAGRAAIGFYLGRSDVGSGFGAAGSLVVVLVWIYYSSIIFFLGAEFTKAWATARGSGIRPDADARPVTGEARAQQGIPRRPAAARSAAAHGSRRAR